MRLVRWAENNEAKSYLTLDYYLLKYLFIAYVENIFNH